VTEPLPPWWRRLLATRWLMLVLVAFLALFLFTSLGDEILEPGANTVDQVTRQWVLAHRWPPLVALSWVLTTVGSAGGTAVLGLAITGWLWLRRHRRIAAVVVTAPVVATAGFDGLKQIFLRTRPPGAALAHITTYSFPSGHATVAAAVWLTLAYTLRRERLISRGAALGLGVAWPVVIGLTRVYLDVHWATDVLGGWCLGTGIAALATGLYEHLARRAPAAVKAGAS
jgi:undecaprenyl-diphosphatase